MIIDKAQEKETRKEYTKMPPDIAVGKGLEIPSRRVIQDVDVTILVGKEAAAVVIDDLTARIVVGGKNRKKEVAQDLMI